jgi:hypothetical protein
MIRTKFYHNVLNLAIERKHRTLLKRKAERDQAKATTAQDQGYLIGLMITRHSPYLTKANKDLCDRMYTATSVSWTDMGRLLKLIGILLMDPRSVVLYRVHPDQIDGGVSAALHQPKKGRKAA